MQMRSNLISGLIILVFIVSGGCFSPNQVSLFNLAGQYKSEGKFTRLNSTIFHTSDTISTLLLAVQLQDFMYKKLEGENRYEARYRVAFKQTVSYDSKEILDSLGAERYCCRRMIISQVDLLKEAAPYE